MEKIIMSDTTNISYTRPASGSFGLVYSIGDNQQVGGGSSVIPTGIKHDQEKPDMSLLSSIAMLKMAEVMTFGKKKYTAHNWRGGFVCRCGSFWA